MNFLSTILSAVRRRRVSCQRLNNVIMRKNPLFPASTNCITQTETIFSAQVVYNEDGKCFNRSLIVKASSMDSSYWFLIRTTKRDHQVHSSNDLMDISYEKSAPIAHFSFTTGLMSVRFPSFANLHCFEIWSKGRVRGRSSGIFAQWVSSPRYEKSSSAQKREVRLMTMDDCIVVIDEIKQRPIVHGTIQQFKSFAVRGHDIRMLSRLDAEAFFVCGRASEFRSWVEDACSYCTLKEKKNSNEKIFSNRRRRVKPSREVNSGIVNTNRRKLSWEYRRSPFHSM